ncbi:MAG TPA: hypothetical protein PLV43_12030, partial [Aequorivita sp.]|nr:hypothetical protein [Aequorivita sp.]
SKLLIFASIKKVKMTSIKTAFSLKKTVFKLIIMSFRKAHIKTPITDFVHHSIRVLNIKPKGSRYNMVVII